ncbi:MAG TPA: glycoside hydrolase family 97 catalytic domain-containing protein [Gemmatimonadaceae bacterium]
MNRFLSLSLALLLCSSSTLAAQGGTRDTTLTVENRERTLRFTLLTDGDSPEYRIDRLTPDGATNVVLDHSPLGITRSHEDFTAGLEFVSASPPTELTSVYRMVSGKQLDIRRRTRQRTFTFRNTSGAPMTLTVRAMHDGIAFRYGFPRAAFTEDSLTGEATGFRLPLGGSGWLQPYRRGQAPPYESDFRNGVPIGTAAPDESGWALPMLFHSEDEWVLITEAGLDRTSYGVHVERQADGGVYRVRLPEEDEADGGAPRAAAIGFPWLSPWRIVIVGQTLATIVESTAVTDLAPAPTTTDLAWIRPGRASWSAWSDSTSPRDYQKVFPFVALASQLQWEYSLLGRGWPEMTNGGDVNDLLEYAKARNVGLTVWYDVSVAHNDTPEAISSVVLTNPEARRAEFRRIAGLGVKGIAVNFIPSDKQAVIGLYEDILRDAAASHLLVTLRGSTIPRGWQRTFPNLLSMEAVRGARWYADSAFDDNAALYNTIYPFTRNVIGPMDYTPMIFGNVPGQYEHLTTNPHELALSVVFESGLQHFVSTPTMIDKQPEFVKQFLQVVPTVWDETRFVDGFPGKFIVLARRRGPDWYVGAITSDTLVSAVEVPLRFLGAGAYNVGLISDGEDYDQFASNSETLTNRDTMTVELAPRGGFVARIKPTGLAPAAPTPAKPAEKPAAKPAPAKQTPTPANKPRPRVPPRRAP